MGAPVNRAGQSMVLTVLGAVALRIAWTDEYARYVNEWMRWPLFISGLLLVGLALTSLLSSKEDDDHPTTHVAWLLLLPVAIAFVIQPPALGSYVAERRSNEVAPAAYEEAAVAPLPEGDVIDLPVSGFVARATMEGGGLEGRAVRLTGFVTHDKQGGWYVTRLTMFCCAADVSAFKVRVQGAEAPARDAWVRVTGTWVDGTGIDPEAGATPAVTATDVTPIKAPKFTYE